MDSTISEDEKNAMKELLYRELNGHSTTVVPQIVALALETKGLAKVVSEAPPTYRLTEKGKKIIEGE